MQHLADNVEADAASGHLGYLVSSAESGPENQIDNLLLCHALGVGCRNHTHFQGFELDLFRINTTAVVADFNDELIGLVISIEDQLACRRLTCSGALSRALNPVTNGVSDNVRERFSNCVKQHLVEVSILTAEFECHLFAAALSRIANDAGKAAEQLLNRNHPNLHYRALQVIQDSSLERHGIGKT